MIRIIPAWVYFWLAVLGAVRGGVPSAVGAAAARGVDPLGEQKIEFMLNLAEFVEWPAGHLMHAEQPLVLGVMGEDPFGEMLRQALDGKRVAGRRVVLREFKGALELRGEELPGRRQEELTTRRARKLQELRECHLLFLCGSERSQVPTILKGLKGAPVLTVGDTEAFTRQGGMIGLVPRGKGLRLEINAAEAQQAGLRISSKLLAVSTVTGTETFDGDR